MRWVMALAMAVGLASCDAYQTSQISVSEAGKLPAAVEAVKPPARDAESPSAGSPDAIAVVTGKTVPDYYKDLEHCRAVVAAAMGPPGAQDDLEALRRALKDHPHDRTLSPTYVNDDRAIRRRESIKQCLSRSGYLVK